MEFLWPWQGQVVMFFLTRQWQSGTLPTLLTSLASVDLYQQMPTTFDLQQF